VEAGKHFTVALMPLKRFINATFVMSAANALPLSPSPGIPAKSRKGKTFQFPLKRKLWCFHSPSNSFFIKLIALSDKIDLCGDRRQLYADAVPNGSVADRKLFMKI